MVKCKNSTPPCSFSNIYHGIHALKLHLSDKNVSRMAEENIIQLSVEIVLYATSVY